VIIAERGFGTMEDAHVLAEPAITSFDQPQLIPQGLNLLPPFVKIGGSLGLLGVRQGLTAAPVRRSNPSCDGCEAPMPWSPTLRVLSHGAKPSLDLLPRTVFIRGFRSRMFVR
jgi:hypothetical protein